MTQNTLVFFAHNGGPPSSWPRQQHLKSCSYSRPLITPQYDNQRIWSRPTTAEIQAMFLIRDALALAAADGRPSDQLIGAVAKMASYEAMFGDQIFFEQHMAGLVKTIRLRGGLSALGQSMLARICFGLIAILHFWITLQSILPLLLNISWCRSIQAGFWLSMISQNKYMSCKTNGSVDFVASVIFALQQEERKKKLLALNSEINSADRRWFRCSLTIKCWVYTKDLPNRHIRSYQQPTID